MTEKLFLLGLPIAIGLGYVAWQLYKAKQVEEVEEIEKEAQEALKDSERRSQRKVAVVYVHDPETHIDTVVLFDYKYDQARAYYKEAKERGYIATLRYVDEDIVIRRYGKVEGVYVIG